MAMGGLFDVDAWREVWVRALRQLGENIADFLPNLVGATLLLLLGWAVSRAVEVIAARGLHAVGLDRAAARLRVGEILHRAGVRLGASELVAKLLFWLLLLTFILSSVETLGLAGVTATLDRLIAFIPNLVGAALIVLFGLLAARLAAALVGSATAAAGVSGAPRLGTVVHAGIGTLAVVLAADQLGVATEVLVLPLTVAFGAAAFAVGLAFALGARPIITHILAGHFLKQSLPRDTAIEVDGERGLVERVGAVDTLLRGDGHAWSVPNAQLLERVVRR
jgi:hypothetical protein